MTTILSAVAIIALLWTTLSALPAGLEARMPLPYMIALTPAVVCSFDDSGRGRRMAT